MIVKQCYIENFGTFHDKTFNFTDGINVITEDNGWGKSTLASFIKAMFYGLEYSRKKKLTEYRKYEPWQGGKYGGYLTFSVNGKDYRVARYFGRKESDCVFELYDLTTNKPSSDFGENLGEELFGIDCQSFERSIFIKLNSEQGQPQLSDSISAKLNNLVDNTDDINNFETARARLDKLASSIMLKRGSGGMTGDIDNEIMNIKDRLLDCGRAEREISVLQKQISQSKEQSERLSEREKELLAEHNNYALFDKKENYETLLKNARTLREDFDNLAEFFRNGVPADEEIIAHTRETNDIGIYAAQIAHISQIEDKNAELSGAKPNTALVAMFAAIAVLGLCTSALIDGIIAKIIGIILVIIGAAGLGFCITSRKKETVRSRNKHSALNDAYAEAKAAEEEIKTSLLPFLAKYEAEGSEYFERMQYIRDKLIAYRDVQNKLSEAEARLKSFEDNNNTAELLRAAPPKYSKADLEKQLDEYRAQINAYSRQIAGAERDISRQGSIADNRGELESELERLNERRAELTEKHTILTETIAFLTEAKDNMTSSYMKDMTEAFNKYIHMIEPTQESIVLNADLDTYIVDSGLHRESGHHSRGYADMANICTRLALSDVMYKEAKPFLILDDPFVNLDDKKTERALEFLKKIGEDRQIFYFVCQKSRSI